MALAGDGAADDLPDAADTADTADRGGVWTDADAGPLPEGEGGATNVTPAICDHRRMSSAEMIADVALFSAVSLSSSECLSDSVVICGRVTALRGGASIPGLGADASAATLVSTRARGDAGGFDFARGNGRGRSLSPWFWCWYWLWCRLNRSAGSSVSQNGQSTGPLVPSPPILVALAASAAVELSPTFVLMETSMARWWWWS